MNLDNLKKDDRSGMLSRESYVIKNFNKEYNYIINYCEKYSLSSLPFKEKLYCVIYGYKEIPLCKNDNCHNKVKYKNKTLGYNEYCSNKCQSTCPIIVNKKKETCLKRYGVEIPIFNENIKNKFVNSIKKTDLEQKNINAKREETCLKKYKVKSVANIESIKKKKIENFKKNIHQYKENYKKTCLKKYGVEHPWMNENIHYKSIISNYKRFDEILFNTFNNLDIKCINRKKGFQSEIVASCDLNKDHSFEIHYQLLNHRYRDGNIICTKCNPINNSISSFHIEVLEYIKTIYSGEIIMNDRVQIQPQEIDIYLPDLKIGIECNGLYWHSEQYRTKNYHRDKYLKCLEKNIHLIQIYDDDFLYKKNIIKSRLKNIINKNNINKIYARKCEIKSVDNNEVRKFLIENHLQGFVMSKIKLGLYYENELISLMIFGKLRKALNSVSKTENEWELLRFCSKIEYSVIGGASKLFNFFKKNYNPTKIVSYSMLEWGSGGVYEKLGFENKGKTSIGYYYIINNIKKHRFQYQKSKLVKSGFDSNMTEYEIMLSNGHDRIWTVGNQKWIWNK